MSMSKTDSWWMNNVCSCLEKGKSELIIYNFETKLPEESVKDNFLKACTNKGNINIEEIKEKIFVVQLHNNDNYFLGLRE